MNSSDGINSYLVDAMSTQVALGISASFTSPWMPVHNVLGIRNGAFSNVAGTLFTEHSPDAGVTISRSSAQPVEANKGEFLSFYPRDIWFRVRYVNGATAQTFFTLNTIFSEEAFSTTQSLISASLGRTSLALQARSVLYDYKFDETVAVTPFSRDLLTVGRTSLLADGFVGTTQDTAFWTNTLTGSGTVTQASEQLNLATGVTANSTVKVATQDKGRFIVSNTMQGRISVQLANAGAANNVKRWGFYDATNGFFFELNGTTLNAVSRAGGVDTAVASTSWSSISTFALEVGGGVHSYEIAFFSNVAFFIVDDQVHHLSLGFGRKGHFPIQAENNNSGGSTTNNSLILRGVAYWRYGPDINAPRGRRIAGSATTVLKIGSGGLKRIVLNSASVTGTISIYDNTAGSGALIAVITTSAGSNAPPVSLEYGIDFSVGLTIVTVGAAYDLTVVFD